MSGPMLTRWADLIMARAYHAGVRHVVISPGSRSTAFVLAADRHPGLECHDALDERVAGFVALGIGRATGVPALLVCTSGTAPAHYYPAVIEATLQRIPLLVLSADRPLELVDCAAPQTIDQVKLFGDHVRRYVDLGLPDPSRRALLGTARAVDQAVLTATWPTAGAVHLNARARKPFEPDSPSTPADQAFDAEVARLCEGGPQVHRACSVPSEPAIASVVALCERHAKGVILLGPASVDAEAWRPAVVALARATGYPVLAEGASQLRFFDRPEEIVWVDHFDLLLKSAAFRDAHVPEVVLQIGAPPVAGGIEHWLDAHRPTRVVIADDGWNDWLGTATHFVFGAIHATLDTLAEACPPRPHDAPWQRAWSDAETRACRAVEAVLDAEPLPTEGHAVRALLGGVPSDAFLMVGNSLSIRLLDWYSRGTDAGSPVLSQRGANGIDGLISAAVGAVRATGRATVLLLGDVSAVHDLNGLLLAHDLPAALVVVVVDNGGGRIFDILPVARHPRVPEGAMRHLSTPHGVDFCAVAQAYRVGYRRVLPDDLADATRDAIAEGGATLLDVPVAPDRAAAMLRAIRARLDA